MVRRMVKDKDFRHFAQYQQKRGSGSRLHPQQCSTGIYFIGFKKDEPQRNLISVRKDGRHGYKRFIQCHVKRIY